jgi:hypothetical protein
MADTRRSSIRNRAAVCVALGLCWAQDSRPQEEPVPTFGTTVVIPSGLRGQIYFIPVGTYMLPKFDALRPVGTIYTSSLNVWPRYFSDGFPSITNRFEWFAIDYTGRFWIEKPAEYRFSLTADDGAKLYIDDRVVVNNDGVHAPETLFGRVSLSCGIHRIRVSFFQGPRFALALVLSVAGPHEKWRIFSTEEFKPPPNPEDWKSCEAPLLFETDALAALKARPLPHAFEFRAAVLRFGNYGANSRGALVFTVPAASLTATPQRDNTAYKLHVSVLALVKDAKDQVVDKFSLDAPYDVPAANLPGVRASTATFTHPVSLPPGRYTVEAAVLDRERRTASAGVSEYESPAPSQGIGLSSVMLVDRVEPVSGPAEASDPFVFEKQRVVPLLDTNLTPEAKPHVYFVVYPDKSNAEKPKIQVEFLVEGQLLAKQTAELPPPDANGAIPMVVSAATRPGSCELRITAMQGSQSASQSVKYAIKAK